MTKKLPLQTVLIVGLGNIGKRHLGNIRRIRPKMTIVALRHKNSKADRTSGVNFVVNSIKDALVYNPDLAIITNPSSLHVSTALPLAGAGVHLFIEKPISSSIKDVKKLLSLAKKNNCKLMVGYNLRFSESLKFFRKEILNQNIGKILSIRSEVGQNLKSWRPKNKYVEGVSAKKELGGGVLLELSHEFDYLSWIFGPINWVSGYITKQSNLEINVEDIAHCLLGFKDKNQDIVANVSLDFIRQDNIRQCTVVGEFGSLRWNGIKNSVELYSKNQSKWSLLFQDQENKDFTYQQELSHFLECILKDKMPLISGESALDTLKVIECIRQSSSEGKRFQVNYEEN